MPSGSKPHNDDFPGVSKPLNAGRLDRRGFLDAAALTAASLALPGSAAAEHGERLALDESQLPAPVRSLRGERDHRPRVRGRIPAGLRGTLHRNGPGLFERDGFRKSCLLDGDGMLQAFDFDDAGVRYRNRFVRTEKFVREEAASRFLYPTWTTRRPGGWLANLGVGEYHPSAGVHAVPWAGSLYALEDASHPYRLDAQTLATEAPEHFGLTDAVFNAHSKVDPLRRQWLHAGIGVTSRELHVSVLDDRARVVSHRRFQLDRGGYVHDFFASERWIAIVMSPVGLSPLPLLTGRTSVAGAFRWNGDEPNHLYLIERDGGDALIRIDAPAQWSWHSVNAYDDRGEIVLDLVGYDEPDHFIGDDPFFWAIMEGRFVPARSPGKVRRQRVDPQRRRLREEIVHTGSCEYPTIHPRAACRRHRYAYLADVRDLSRGLFHDRVTRLDFETGDSESFVFGAGRIAGESVYVPKPGAPPGSAGRSEPGWLLSLVYDLGRELSELLVLDAEAPSAGPLAVVELGHPTPFSFHGSWSPA